MSNTNEGTKGFTNKKKGMAAVLATGIVLAGSFAFFTDEAKNNVSGQMGDLGITVTDTVTTNEEVLEAFLPGDEFTFDVDTAVASTGDAAKVRHRLLLSAEGTELVKSGNVTVKLNDVVTDIQTGEHTTVPYVVNNGESGKLKVSVQVNDTTLNEAKLKGFSVDVITEALQDRNTTDESFTEVKKTEFTLETSDIAQP